MDDRERLIAIREAEQIHSSTEYFDARPHLTSMESRRVFDAGFMRGFNAATERLRAAQPAVSDVPAALGALSAAMRADPDYAWTWHCNVAMVAQDAGAAHDKANVWAAEFMRRAFGVDTLTRVKAEFPNAGPSAQPKGAQPAVPDEWREVVTMLARDLEFRINTTPTYPHIPKHVLDERYERDMAIVVRARELLAASQRTEGA